MGQHIRAGEGVRVLVKATRETGTALYAPIRKDGVSYPGFSGMGNWMIPVQLDSDSVVLCYLPSELEPGPARREVRELGDRRVRSKADRKLIGTIMRGANIAGGLWPGFDRFGHLRLPVRLDDGDVVTWRAEDLEQLPVDPEPDPAPVVSLPEGPMVLVKDSTADKVQVLYRHAGPAGKIWPNFGDDSYWRVPVKTSWGANLLIRAEDLTPLTKWTPTPDESAQSLREVAEAAVDALQLFTDRLRAVALKGDDT